MTIISGEQQFQKPRIIKYELLKGFPMNKIANLTVVPPTVNKQTVGYSITRVTGAKSFQKPLHQLLEPVTSFVNLTVYSTGWPKER